MSLKEALNLVIPSRSEESPVRWTISEPKGYLNPTHLTFQNNLARESYTPTALPTGNPPG
jgi:hypothetical protein